MALTLVTRLTIGVALLATAQGQGQPAKERERAPLVLIDRPQAGQYGGLWNPQIHLRPDGTYIATVEEFGEWHSGGARVYRSTDRALNWTNVAALGSPSGASLFELQGSLYLLGVDAFGRGAIGDPVIVRSTDSGATWSHPSGETTGLLRQGIHLEAGDVPVLIQSGRVWRPFGRTLISEGARHISVLVASAPTEADLLRADSWTWSEELSLKGHEGCSFRDSTLIPSENSTPVLFIPGESSTAGLAAVISSDGLHLTVRAKDPQWQTPERPVGSARPRDPKSGRVFVLTQTGRAEERSDVVLKSSSDLLNWETRSVLISDHRRIGISFRRADWLVDGDDLVAAIYATEPWQVEPGSASSSIEGSLFFLRVPSFRDRSPQTPPLWESGK